MSLSKLTEEQVKDDAEQQLRTFKRTKNFLVAIDTDGCITDNMNGKQVLIFHPQFMEFFKLWGIESYFREVGEYYNLFSVDRGCNRFIAISLMLKALSSRVDVQKTLAKKNIELPDATALNKYIDYTRENKLGLGNPSLENFIAKNPTDFCIYKLLGWSEAVNRTFPYISAKIPPFNNVRESLALMSQSADIMVVSKTPYADLADYWEKQGIADYVQVIAGQEMGSKAHHIAVAKRAGEYEDDCVMMIGDGKGDLKGVKTNNGLFYPIAPGKEQEAWNKFPEAFEIFIQKKYKGEFENHLLTLFDEAFLTTPAWEQPDYDHIAAYREKQEMRKKLYDQFNPGGKLLTL